MTRFPSHSPAVVTLQNCDSEPIHVPGAIQPSGVLMGVDAGGLLAYVSANLHSVLGVDLALGKPLDTALFPQDVADHLGRWLSDIDADFEPFKCTIGASSFDVIAHRNVDNVLIIEFESSFGQEIEVAPMLNRAYRTVEKLRRQRSVESLLDVAVMEIRAITGFDRVMAYRFHADDSGEVVREARRADLDDWQGRRYPASDIPAQARRLYIENTLRLIADAHYEAVPVRQALHASALPLDLSNAVLRSVSPIHLEYMANMGVRASMSISVVIDGRLWGMIACHHLASMHVDYGIRMACEVVAQILSVTIASYEAQARAKKSSLSMASINRIVQRVWNDEDVLAALTQEVPTPAVLVPSDACVCLWSTGMVVCEGIAPGIDMREVAAVLGATRRRVVACTNLAQEFPQLQAGLAPYAGLLACCFDASNDGWLLWLRREQIETLVWGGKPEKIYKVGAFGPRLTPRGSFEAWREVVRETSMPWLSEELTAAESLRDELAQICNSRGADMDRARTALLAMLGHDLRDPLQSISAAAQLLTRSEGKGAKMGERIRTSSNRMQRLISQVMDLSRLQSGLGLGMSPAACDLGCVIHELVEEMRLAQSNVVIDAQIQENLDLIADSDRLAQVISNLLSNAIKHGTMGAPVQLIAKRVNDCVRVSVINAGEPIPDAQREHLFLPFKPQSLSLARNRSGLGLGLYIAHQIVTSHGGSLDVQCVDGNVIFIVELPTSGHRIAPARAYINNQDSNQFG